MQDDKNIVSGESITFPEIILDFAGKRTTYHAKGIGAYPWECLAKDKYPNDMVYVSDDEKAWLHASELVLTSEPLVFKLKNFE